jgi:hypothetical protein
MKPDWATRLQRTFARKYDAGFAKGLMFGKAVGARDERDRIVALLTDRIENARVVQYGVVTAMMRPVRLDDLEAIYEAMIYAINLKEKINE